MAAAAAAAKDGRFGGSPVRSLGIALSWLSEG